MQKKTSNILSNVLFIMPEHNFYYASFKGSGLNVLPIYKGKDNVVLRVFREIHFSFNLPFKHIWFHKVDKEYESYFIFECLVIPEYIDWLHSLYPHSKIIMLYLNNCTKVNSPEKFRRDFLKLWSGDINDCHNYNLNLCPNVGSYVRSWTVTKTEPKFDIFFIGSDKGNKRLGNLINLERQFNLLGLTTYFHIAPEHRYDLYKNKRYKKFLPYTEVLKFLGKTKAILYLGYGSQECITIRVQESLVHKIKLITDCVWLKKYDFFHPDNIFILGEDEIESLPEFINKPYVEIETSVLNNIYIEDLVEYIILNS